MANGDKLTTLADLKTAFDNLDNKINPTEQTRISQIISGTSDGYPNITRHVDDVWERIQLDAGSPTYWRSTDNAQNWTAKKFLFVGDVKTPIVETKIMSGKDVNTHDAASWTLNLAKTGYTPILAVPARFAIGLVCYYCLIENSTLTFALYNSKDYNLPSGDVYVNVLYV